MSQGEVQILQDYSYYTKNVFHILFSQKSLAAPQIRIEHSIAFRRHLKLRRCCPLFASPIPLSPCWERIASNQRKACADAGKGLQLLSTLQLLKPGMQCPHEPSLLKSVQYSSDLVVVRSIYFVLQPATFPSSLATKHCMISP